MKVCGYIRVSTDEQKINGHSLEAQKSRIEDYCRLYGLELVDIVSDPGQSAKSLKRPGLQSLLSRVENGEIQGIAISKLDRLSRSLKDWNFLVEQYFSGKANLFSVEQSIDTRSSQGKFFLNICFCFAEMERSTLSERVTQSLQHRKKQGIHCGRNGYGFQMKDGRLVPDEAEQRNIALAHLLKERGFSLDGIAKEFEARKIPSKRGGKWRPNTVRNLLIRSSRNFQFQGNPNEGGKAFWNHDEKVIIQNGAENGKEADDPRFQKQSVKPWPSASPKN